MATRLSRHDIATAIVRLIDENNDSRHIARRIAAYLMEQGRTKELDSLMRDVMQLRAGHGTVEVTATSAFPLTKQVKTHIEKLAAAIQGSALKQVITNEVIDAKVLGGIRIETPGEQLDLTIRARLDKLKQATKVQRTTHGLIR